MSTALNQPCQMTAAVSQRGIAKSYKHFRLNNIDLEIEPGTLNGLIGPNGAGKSTIMRIMMGLVMPDQGPVSVLGQSISSREASTKRDIGCFSDDMRLYKSETIAFHMQFIRSLFPGWDEDYAQQLLDRFGLIAQQKVKGLSHGQRVKSLLLLILALRRVVAEMARVIYPAKEKASKQYTANPTIIRDENLGQFNYKFDTQTPKLFFT